MGKIFSVIRNLSYPSPPAIRIRFFLPITFLKIDTCNVIENLSLVDKDESATMIYSETLLIIL